MWNPKEWLIEHNKIEKLTKTELKKRIGFSYQYITMLFNGSRKSNFFRPFCELLTDNAKLRSEVARLSAKKKK
jgi:hypothetical protein